MSQSTKDNIVIDVGKCTGCRNCQLICSLIYAKAFNPTKARIVIEDQESYGKQNVYFTDECVTNCHLCTAYCVYGAIERKEGAN